jgi:hypothetical protein
MTTEKIDWKSCTVDTTELINTLGTLTDSLVRVEKNKQEIGDFGTPERLHTLAMCSIAISLNDISNSLEDINVGGIAAHVYKGE